MQKLPGVFPEAQSVQMEECISTPLTGIKMYFRNTIYSTACSYQLNLIKAIPHF